MAPLLSVEDLRVGFKVRDGSVTAVDGVSFDVDAGECVGVVGESGLREDHDGMAIMGLLAANGHVSGGRILFDGTDLALAARERDASRPGQRRSPSSPRTR